MRFNSLLLLFCLITVDGRSQVRKQILVNPSQIAADTGDAVLTVSGSGFSSGMQVFWNGEPRATRFVNDFQLKATIVSTELTKPALASVFVGDPASGQQISDAAAVLVYLRVAHNDLIYDGSRNRIYLSVSKQDSNGPAVGLLDPDAGVVQRYIPLPSEPGVLALTADAHYLYVSMADRIRRMDLTEISPDVEIPFATLLAKFPKAQPLPSTWFVRSLVPLTATPGSFVVAFQFAYLLGSGADDSVVMAVDGTVPRSGVWRDSTACLNTIDQVTFFISPGLRRNVIDSAGFGSSPSTLPVPLAGTTCPVMNAGFIYGSNGEVVAPQTSTIAGWVDSYGKVDAAPERGELYFLNEAVSSNLVLTVFDLSSWAQKKALPLPTQKSDSNLRLAEGRLIHWGKAGIAFGDYSSTKSAAGWLYLFQIP